MALGITGRHGQGRRRRERPSRISADAGDLPRQPRRRSRRRCRRRTASSIPTTLTKAVDDQTVVRRRAAARTSSAASKRSRRSATRRARHGALFVVSVRSDQPRPAEAARRLRRRHRRRRRAVAGHPDGVRRAVPRHPGLPRGVRPQDARPARRPDGRPPRQALLGADAADPRAAHPPREGDEQHLHEPGPVRPAGGGLPRRARARRGCRRRPSCACGRRTTPPSNWRRCPACRCGSTGRSSRSSRSSVTGDVPALLAEAAEGGLPRRPAAGPLVSGAGRRA